jgi:MYXO-CTERM domain-containing protein
LYASSSFSDNFNDGNDAGWARYETLAPFGAGGTYSFPSGGYEISAPASPDANTLGPNRVGAIADGVTVGNSFTASVDVVNWSRAAFTAIGIAARGSNIGLGTTDAYVAHVDVGGTGDSNGEAEAFIERVDGEQTDLSSLASAAGTFPLPDPSEGGLHLVFTGDGSLLTLSVYDVNNLTTPLVTVSGTDSTYTSGAVGLLTSGLIDVNTGAITNSPLDATYDNFSVVPEPGALGVLGLGVLALRRKSRRLQRV